MIGSRTIAKAIGMVHGEVLKKCRRIARMNEAFRSEVKESQQADKEGRLQTVYYFSDLGIRMFASTLRNMERRRKLEELLRGR